MKKQPKNAAWLMYPWLVCLAMQYGIELPAQLG